MNIYDEIDYRSIIKKLAKRRCVSFKTMAQRLAIHTSYFSRVMVNRAHFSQEQLYGIGKLFEFDQESLDYFLLLGLLDSSGTSVHRQYIKNQVEQIRQNKLKLKEVLEKVETVTATREDFFNYYLDPLTAKIHMYLTLDKYLHNPSALIKRIHISEERLQDELKKLEQLKLIQIKNQKITVLKDSLNLDEGDPLSAINHSNWRLEAVKNISKREPKLSDYHFTVAFSATEETKQAIKQKFKDFLVDAQKLVMKVDRPDEVYYMDFDLFGD